MPWVCFKWPLLIAACLLTSLCTVLGEEENKVSHVNNTCWQGTAERRATLLALVWLTRVGMFGDKLLPIPPPMLAWIGSHRHLQSGETWASLSSRHCQRVLTDKDYQRCVSSAPWDCPACCRRSIHVRSNVRECLRVIVCVCICQAVGVRPGLKWQ